MHQLLIVLFLLFSTVIDGKITLDDPIRYPKNFGELYLFVETQENGWVFDECEVSGSRLYWNSATNLFKETSKEFEDRAFEMLMFLALADREYSYDICGDTKGKPILFGPGVSEFMQWYSNPTQYEKERLPVIAESVVENLANLIYIFGVP